MIGVAVQVDTNLVWQFKDVLDCLLDTVVQSIQQTLCQERANHSSQLVTNCCNLLAKVVAELAAQARGIIVSSHAKVTLKSVIMLYSYLLAKVVAELAAQARSIIVSSHAKVTLKMSNNITTY